MMADGGHFRLADTSQGFAEVGLGSKGGAWVARIGNRMRDTKERKTCEIVGFDSPVHEDGDIVGYRRVIVEYDGGGRKVTAGDDLEDYEPPLELWSYASMLLLDEPSWTVGGLIQHSTSALLFGKSNAFKSFMAVDIACSVATGTPWHGCEVAQGAVIYVATEGARGLAKQRIPGWMEHHGIPHDRRNGVFVIPAEVAIDTPQGVADLIETIDEIYDHLPDDGSCDHIALVVLDIFGSTMNGSEIEDTTARAWVQGVNRLMRERDCAVLTVAHTGWADDSRARMHTHFWGSFDTRLKAEGDKDALTATLRVERHKDADSAGSWGFRMERATAPDGSSTLVPVLADDVDQRPKRRVSGKSLVALQALDDALAHAAAEDDDAVGGAEDRPVQPLEEPPRERAAPQRADRIEEVGVHVHEPHHEAAAAHGAEPPAHESANGGVVKHTTTSGRGTVVALTSAAT